MLQLRKATERGHFDHGWLDTYHTFSFGEYYDPAHNQFRSLRVMNEDRVQPGQGFGSHPHRDMEIVTYVLEGALAHKDSMGHGEVLRPGEFQRMSAGRGIVHSEFNPSSSEPAHFYQIWLMPAERGLEPSYEQRGFAAEDRRNRWQLVASPDAANGSLQIHQDARIHLADLDAGTSLSYPLAPGRHAWVQVLRGKASVNGASLDASDGAAISDEFEVAIQADGPTEIMLFDLN